MEIEYLDASLGRDALVHITLTRKEMKRILAHVRRRNVRGFGYLNIPYGARVLITEQRTGDETL